ncbi:MAG: efflux RND transporter permease subunit [Deltaproteobacteria bacterium]|nr:efflux RND transporter permease subunit [Candidatus Anaeroferrophillacea bacterium]
MNLIRYFIEKPVTAAVAVILVVMFGIIGLKRLPVQLTPDVQLPEITVRTTWPGATPYEIEQEIIEDQEDALKGLENLVELESSSYNDFGEIRLTFRVGTDIDAALLRTSNKLDEVPDYPENVDRPIIDAAGANSSPVIWLLMQMKAGDPELINHYRTFFEDEVRQHLERVPGVGSLFIGGGTERELHIEIEPTALARRRISIMQVVDAVQSANRNVSAGVLGIGKKDYRVRTVSQYQTPQEPLETVIADSGYDRVRLGEVATSGIGYDRETVSVMLKGVPSLVVGVRKEQGANVIELTERVRGVVDDLNAGLLADHNLHFHWAYDQTPYIFTAIDIVKDNVLIGGLLAIAVLLLFLRSVSSTAITAVAIPVSVIGTFISLWVLKRNLNVVSLAGISFAVGMLVDNAIVVLENIDRHRKLGKDAFAAAYDGTREVVGAVLASTITTVAVFLPVIFIAQEAGQLFRDIAIAISFSILLSFFVSVSVIPSLAFQLYRRRAPDARTGGLVGCFNAAIGRIGERLAGGIMALVNVALHTAWSRIGTVLLLTLAGVAVTAWLIPKAEYLPQGNRNLLLNILVPPPGLSVKKRKEIGHQIYDRVRPYAEADGVDGLPQIDDLFYVAAPEVNLFGVTSTHETEARRLLPLMNRVINGLPDIFGVSLQVGIFESDIGEGRSIDVNLSGARLEDLVGAGRLLFSAIQLQIPGSQVRPVPSLEISYPEAVILPDKERLIAHGMREDELGIYADILMDGRQAGEYKPDGQRQIDLVITGSDRRFTSPEAILAAPLSNARGDLLRLGDVARLEYRQGMTQVNHLERRRTVKLQVTPPEEMPLQEAMETIATALVAPLQEQGKLAGVAVALGGNADKLVQTRDALQWNLLLAVVIVYLLMAALFENFFYPLIILFSVPLAAAGGFVGLRLVNLFIAPQGFDVVTMLGFIILVGTVVNNAILIVHQTLNNVRYEGFAGIEAVRESVKTRIRPIFMSTITTLFGMLPLVVATGSGSELYRGIGSVLLGGLLVSTVFTLFIIPSLLVFFIGREQAREEPQV